MHMYISESEISTQRIPYSRYVQKHRRKHGNCIILNRKYQRNAIHTTHTFKSSAASMGGTWCTAAIQEEEVTVLVWINVCVLEYNNIYMQGFATQTISLTRHCYHKHKGSI